MIRSGIKLRRKRPQLESMGIVLFTVSMWMYSIFPLFSRHPFLCFTALSAVSVIYLALCSFYMETGYYVRKSNLIWLIALIPLVFSNLKDFNVFNGATILTYAFGIVFIIFCCHTTDHYEIGILTLKILVTVYILSIFFQYFSGELFGRLFSGRFDSSALSFYEASVKKHFFIGMGGSPGVATVNCTIALAIVISFTSPHNWKSYIVKIPHLIIIFSAFILIGKKSGMVSAAFAAMVVYLLISSNKIWKKAGILLICTVLFCAVLYLITQIYSSSYLSLKIREGFNQLIEGRDFSSGRIYLYRNAWSEFIHHPFFGIGWSRFSPQYGNLVHNIYLQLLCETGMIGFVLFIFPALHMYFRSCKLILRLNREGSDKDLFNYMIFSLYIQSEFLFISLFENNLYMIMPLYLYFFACGIAFTAEQEFNVKRRKL